ncbi:hypothetical protein [Anaeromyxobacter sp. PSR-1]|uniref:hypothetical protein n=1 Tax=Anaeromyxobacter sp. PSR-1 TaxID=1300915 RepID=UPI0005E8B0D1|nr:hypothetical protein [Anaeromyxobacter sp. PSR-1]GAO03125.1 hypothetical protein PSR1_02008 [Anaeromyxobacter sp. PSR-1]
MPLRLLLGALLVLVPRLAFAGVTLHYEGTARTAAAAKAVLAAAVAFARGRGWPVSAGRNHVVLRPHARSEPIELRFEGRTLQPSSVKTQFAGVETHLAVVELLQRLDAELQSLTVEDDGGYWETGDRQALVAAFDEVDELLARELQKPGTSGPYRLPSGRIVDVIVGPVPREMRPLPVRRGGARREAS